MLDDSQTLRSSLIFKLAPEEIWLLCDYLDAESIGWLRLVSKPFMAIFTPCFLRYFHSQSVDLTRQGIQRLCDLTSREHLRHSVRMLNLICVYYHPPPTREDIFAGYELTWAHDVHMHWSRHSEDNSVENKARKKNWITQKLAEQVDFSGEAMCRQLETALRNLSSLEAISLEATVVCSLKDRRGPETVSNLQWRGLWGRAIQAHRVVMSAISRSGCKVQTLSIYQKTAKCSIPTSELAGELLFKIQGEGFDNVAANLRSLAISVATTVGPPRPSWDRISVSPSFYDLFDISRGRKLEQYDPLLEEGSDFEGVTRFLSLMRSLESLDIHLYNTTAVRSTVPSEQPYQCFLESLFDRLTSSSLKSLALRFVTTNSRTLMDILSHHTGLREIRLDNIFLVSGSWNQVLISIRDQCTSLVELHLSNLWRPDGCGVTDLQSSSPSAKILDKSDVHYRSDWFFNGVGNDTVWHTRSFVSSEFVELDTIGLTFQSSGIPGKSSASAHYWMCDSMLGHGPP
jgi:hypothetical protein